MPTSYKAKTLIPAIEACIAAHVPIFLWGDPGIGKSQILQQIGTRVKGQVRDVRAVLLDPVDLRGLPTVNGDHRAHWAIPEFLPQDGSGLLLFDELNRAPSLVQNACLQLVLDRKLGEYTLPQDWDLVAAGNVSGTGLTKMSDALKSRFVHFHLEVSLEDWCKWAITHGIEPAVIAFLRFRPELLHKYDPTSGDSSFPCPRTWEFVSRITAQQTTGDVELALFQGTVGEGAAIEYAAFLKLFRHLPSIDAILLNPDKTPVPTNDIGSLWAIASALAKRANDQNLKRVLIYLDRMPQEYGIMAVRDAVMRDASLASSPDFTQWAIKHSDVVF